jgi:hypothetical protein
MGASNLAARRAAKANRRKAIVFEKRKNELAMASPAGQAAQAAAMPIRACLLSEDLFETGMGTLVLARGAGAGPVFFEAYLLDTFCRGVKDVMARTLDSGQQLDACIDQLNASTPLVAVDPSYARKLLRDLVQWSGSIGFPPPRSFAALEQLFGDVDADACNTEFEFGQAGKPLYVSGPGEPLGKSRRVVDLLSARLGSNGFNYIVGSAGPRIG